MTDAERWLRFVAELPERIAQIRAEEAPHVCPTCGSTTPEVIERRVCARCHLPRPISEFHRNRSKAGGRRYHCRECASVKRAERWQREKRLAAGVLRKAS